jgi:hypothetical protein
VDGDCDGFEHGGFGERQGVWQTMDDARRNGDEFRERAGAAVVGAGDAQDLAIVAEIDLAAAAMLALAAEDGGVEGNAVAFGETLYGTTDGRDFARGFVAHDDWGDAATGGAVVTVDIAAADAAGGDADENFVWSRNGRGEIGNLQLTVL